MSVNNPFAAFQQLAQSLMPKPKQSVQPTPAAPNQLLPWADNRQLPPRDGPAIATAEPSRPGTTQAQQAVMEATSARHVWRYADYQSIGAQPTYGFMAFPTVERGRIQEILFVTVTQGGDPSISPTGSAVAFISAVKPMDGASLTTAVANVIASSAASPNAFPFTSAPSRRQLFAHEGERIIIMFKALANSTNMVGALSVIDYDYATWLKSLTQA